MKNIVFSFLGTQLDMAGKGPDRWKKWRPNVNMTMRDDTIIDRLELFVQGTRFNTLTEQVIHDIALVSPETEVRVHQLSIKDPWDFQNVYEALHDFTTQYRFQPDREKYLVHMTTGTHVAQICLFLLTEAHYFPATLLQSSPPRGRQSPTQGSLQEIDLDLSKYDTLATRFAKEKEAAQDLLKSGIQTRNAKFNAMIEQVEKVALRSTAPMLITGPTGAGKSYLAKKIYELRQDRSALDGRFVELNCATLRGDTAMSMLFGHVKGAFTGAASNRPGLLREAHQGMLFLDEIGELGMDEQAMLLRAIEEGKWMPVGSDTEVKAQFLLIAGTNRDLNEAVSLGTFREDLLARLNIWTYQLPGLAQRRDDIEPNLDYELTKFSKLAGQGITMNKEARTRFLSFAQNPEASWRGNFRDLNAAVTRMATLAPRGRIRTEEVEEEIARLQQNWHRPTDSPHPTLEDYLSPEQVAQIDPFDRPQLAFVLSTCQQSRSLSEAGRTLYAVSRAKKKNPNDADRLKKYLAKFELSFEQISALG